MLNGYDEWLTAPYERAAAQAEARDVMLEAIEQEIRQNMIDVSEAVNDYIGEQRNVKQWDEAIHIAARHGETDKLIEIINSAIKQEAERRLRTTY